MFQTTNQTVITENYIFLGGSCLLYSISYSPGLTNG